MPHIRAYLRIAAVVCAALTTCAVVRAQSLDTAFNPAPNGRIVTIAVQPDGKILIGGTFTALGSGAGAVTRHNLARLNRDGSVDTSFNPGATGKVAAFALQPDGKILVGGSFTALGGGGTGTMPRSKLGRLNADGSIDPNFDPGATGDGIYALAVQPDGRIVVGGGFTALGGGGAGTTPRANIGRLDADGSIDPGFDPGAPGDGVYAIALQKDGRVVAVGDFTTGKGPAARQGIARFNADGSLDTAFNPAPDGEVDCLALQPDGRIVIGGAFTKLGAGAANATPRYFIARLNTDGAPDMGFNPGADGAVWAVAVQADGQIVVSGYLTRLGGGRWGANTRNGIGRVNADGTLDAAFDPGANERVRALVAQADGKILAGGAFKTFGGGGIGTAPHPYLVRLNADAHRAAPSALAPPLPAQIRPFLRDPSGLSGVTATSGTDRSVTIRVIYDNYVKTEGLTKDWGLSLLIEGLEKRVLFDTGAKADIFASNVKQMKLDLATVDLLVLSHEHGDHTGGIPAFVTMRRGIPVLMPRWFTDAFKKRMDDDGLTPMLVGGPAKITEHLYSSGEFDFEIPEQALVLDTRDGLVVITGCSHPGVVDMLRTIKTAFKKNISMVIGGFHLLEKTDAEMGAIIGDLKALGVVKCGATHCTGDKQIGMIKDAFGANYVELGVGNAIVIK